MTNEQKINESTIESIKKQFTDKFKEFEKGITKTSILVAGASGSGKSSLINLVMNRKIAETGNGAPVTQKIQKYSNEKINIYDTAGYESGVDVAEYKKQLVNFINSTLISGEPIDVIWYCINAPVARFTDLDTEIIQELKNTTKRPIAVILTQIDSATEDQCLQLDAAIKAELGADFPVFESSTEPDIKTEKGPDKIYEWTKQQLDESRKESFIYAANRDFEIKKSKAAEAINLCTGTAFTVGFSPIPFSDAAVISPLQIGMLTRIAYIWNLVNLSSIIGELAINTVVQSVGKSTAGSLIKLIPGVGTIVGGIINGSVAAAITYGTGTAFNEACYMINKKGLDNNINNLSEFFGNDFAKKAASMAEQYFKEHK